MNTSNQPSRNRVMLCAMTLSVALAACSGSSDGITAVEGSWVAVSDQSAGTAENGQFRVDSLDNIVAVVNNAVSRWNGTSWDVIAAANAGTQIVYIDLAKNNDVFALIQEGTELQIFEYVGDTWEARTVIDPKFTAFRVKGGADNIFAVTGDTTSGGRINTCKIDTPCTPETPIANISLSYFSCNGCGGGGAGGSGGPQFFAELDETVSKSTGNGDWAPETVQATGMGARVESESGGTTAQISDIVTEYNKQTMTFDAQTTALQGMTHFEEADGSWYAQATGIIYKFEPKL